MIAIKMDFFSEQSDILYGKNRTKYKGPDSFVKDKVLANKIEDSVKGGQKVVVLFGSFHFINQEPKAKYFPKNITIIPFTMGGVDSNVLEFLPLELRNNTEVFIFLKSSDTLYNEELQRVE